MFIMMISASRSRLFYYIMMYSFKEAVMAYLKLAYADPRPYMIDEDIVPIRCSTGFGNPSGHSLAATLSSITIFLDVMHGYTHKGRPSSISRYSLVYYLLLVIALFWAGSIPYTRFLMGVHSLDQIVYGATLGVWAAFTLHFIVRDNIIKYIDDLIDWQENKASLGETFNQAIPAKALATFYVLFELASVITFIVINNHLTPESAEIKKWTTNFEKAKDGECGKLDMTYAL